MAEEKCPDFSLQDRSCFAVVLLTNMFVEGSITKGSFEEQSDWILFVKWTLVNRGLGGMNKTVTPWSVTCG